MYLLAHAYILSEKIARNGKTLPPGEEPEIRRQEELDGHSNSSLALLNHAPLTGITYLNFLKRNIGMNESKSALLIVFYLLNRSSFSTPDPQCNNETLSEGSVTVLVLSAPLSPWHRKSLKLTQSAWKSSWSLTGGASSQIQSVQINLQ